MINLDSTLCLVELGHYFVAVPGITTLSRREILIICSSMMRYVISASKYGITLLSPKFLNWRKFEFSDELTLELKSWEKTRIQHKIQNCLAKIDPDFELVCFFCMKYFSGMLCGRDELNFHKLRSSSARNTLLRSSGTNFKRYCKGYCMTYFWLKY